MTKPDAQYRTEFFVDLTEEKPARILHVDDEPSILKATRQCLEIEGSFQVDAALSVEEAKKKMKKKAYDVIVSDYMMPRQSGLDFLRELRASGNTIPFIVFTGKGREEAAARALNLGADQYLNKEGDPETVYLELAHGIRKAMQRKRERNKRERELRESREKFKQLFLGNPEAAVYVGSDFCIKDVNPRFQELFGYSPDEIIGRNINDVVVPRNKLGEAEALDKKANEGYVYQDTVRKRKDGALVPVSISAAPITIEDQLEGFVGVYKDISQLKKAERELKDTLEKLRVVGRLVRHDVRNKLSVVTLNAFLAKKKLAEDHEALEHLMDIESAAWQAAEIFRFASTYEKLGIEELDYIDAKKSFEEAASLLPDLHANVKNECGGLEVLADSLLQQLFYNLIQNSLEHGEKVTEIKMRYEETDKDGLKLIYEDDGAGLPEAEKEKVFLEGYGKGTGYGLYLIRKICEVYGWIIQETGKYGRGAQFTLTVPRVSRIGRKSYRLRRPRGH